MRGLSIKLQPLQASKARANYVLNLSSRELGSLLDSDSKYRTNFDSFFENLKPFLVFDGVIVIWQEILLLFTPITDGPVTFGIVLIVLLSLEVLQKEDNIAVALSESKVY